MGLFGKKDPCPICGGTVKGLLPTKVEGQAICKDCSKNIDLPDGVLNAMTLTDFRGYLAFRQENELLRREFKATQEINLGFFGDRYCFDIPNRLMCRNDSSWVTIFEGRQIKSFVIREDAGVLFEGSAEGLKCYTSSVPQRIDAMAPMINQARMYEQMERMAERRDDNRVRYDYELPEPFEKFFVEIRFDHPYWNVMTAEKKGPNFGSMPSAVDYLREYHELAATMEQLARALMAVAFPGAPEQRISGNATVVGQSAAAPAASVDVVAEIQRFKELVDLGVITEEEFAAKKRQLLGI